MKLRCLAERQEKFAQVFFSFIVFHFQIHLPTVSVFIKPRSLDHLLLQIVMRLFLAVLDDAS